MTTAFKLRGSHRGFAYRILLRGVFHERARTFDAIVIGMRVDNERVDVRRSNAETIVRDQIFRCERGKGKFIFLTTS